MYCNNVLIVVVCFRFFRRDDFPWLCVVVLCVYALLASFVSGMAIIPVRDLWEFKPLIHSSLIANLENYPGDGQFWYPFADNAPSEHDSDDDGNDDE